MILATLVSCCAGIAVGYLRGGQLSQLAEVRIRLWWLAVAAWVVQVGLFVSPLGALLDVWAAQIHLLTIGLLAIVIVANRALPGLALLGIGLALNATVYAANGGFMPVSAAALEATGNTASLAVMAGGARYQKTVLQQPDSPLGFLGDVLPLPAAGRIYSVGDLVATLGMFVLVAGGMRTEPVTAAALFRSDGSRFFFSKEKHKIRRDPP
jgi:Family of unknown function (DUF5317)